MTHRASARLVVLGGVFWAAGRLPAQGLDTTAAARIDSAVGVAPGAQAPGCAVGVVREGRLVFSRGYGSADLSHGVPITPSTRFQTGSLTKQFTALGLLLLAQEGRLSLDDDIHRFVPELPRYAQRVTLRQLAAHTSGLKDDGQLLIAAGWDLYGDLVTRRDVLDILSRDPTLNFTPGSEFLYSDTGYDLLALVVERASGLAFREFLRQRVFQPLGMDQSLIMDDYRQVVPHLAQAYVRRPRGTLLTVPRIQVVGAGGLVSTVEDLAKWDLEFYQATVGGSDLVAQMLSTGQLASGETTGYAMGLQQGRYRGRRTIEHDGGHGGYVADLMRFPDQRTSVIVLCNIRRDPAELARRVADAVLGRAPATTTASEPVPGGRAGSAPSGFARSGLYFDRQHVRYFRTSVVGRGVLLASGEGDSSFLQMHAGGGYLDSSGVMTALFRGGQAESLIVTFHGATHGYRLERPSNVSQAGLDRLAGTFTSTALGVTWTFVVNDGQLVLRRRHADDEPLRPLFDNGFESNQWILEFRLGTGCDSLAVMMERLRRASFARSNCAAGT